MTNLKDKTYGEKNWIRIVRVIGLIIGILPFIPNTLWYLGLNTIKHSIDMTDGFFVLIGFIFLWGSGNFGTWANALGKTIVDKVKSK